MRPFFSGKKTEIMQLSKTAIKKFKEIYFTEFGKRISDEEANKKGWELLNLFKLIYEPIPPRKLCDP